MYKFNPKVLKGLIDASKLSMPKVAEAVDMSASKLYNYVSGRTVPPLEELVKLADYFDVSLDLIAGRNISNDEIEEANEKCADLEKDAYKKYMSKNAGTYDPTWPYNLLDRLFIDTDAIFTQDQEAGLEKALESIGTDGNFVQLRFKFGETIKKIAELNDCTYDVARNTIERGLRRLRQPKMHRLIIYGLEACERMDNIRAKEALDAQESQTGNGMLIVVGNLGLSTKAMTCLRRIRCENVADIVEYSNKYGLGKVRGLGPGTFTEITAAVKRVVNVDLKY